jgi:GNAT superfamily N-acetyltransferase
VSLALAPATLDEGRALYRSMHALRYAEDRALGGPTLPATDAFLPDAALAEHLRVLRDGELIGRLALRRRRHPGEDALSVDALWVEPERRGQGLASQILGVVETMARAEGHTLMTIDVAASNVRGRRVYASAGLEVRRRSFLIDAFAPPPVAPCDYRLLPGVMGNLYLAVLRQGREAERIGMRLLSTAGGRQLAYAEAHDSTQHTWTPEVLATALSAARAGSVSELYLDIPESSARLLGQHWETYYYSLVKRL